MSYRSLVLVVLLALWPGVGHAQPPFGFGVVDETVDCLSRSLGPAFTVTSPDSVYGYILIDDELAFHLSRQEPHGPRGVPMPKVGGDEVDFWFDNDPLHPPLLLQYVAPIAHGSRDISRDPLYAVGVACFDHAYPRAP